MSKIITIKEAVRLGGKILVPGEKIEIFSKDELQESTKEKVKEDVTASMDLNFPGVDGMITVETADDGSASIYGNIDLNLTGMNIDNPSKAASDAIEALVKALGVTFEEQVPEVEDMDMMTESEEEDEEEKDEEEDEGDKEEMKESKKVFKTQTRLMEEGFGYDVTTGMYTTEEPAEMQDKYDSEIIPMMSEEEDDEMEDEEDWDMMEEENEDDAYDMDLEDYEEEL